MASEVIELGSSDDDSELPEKKFKPLTNAMVHIPRILPGVTIKPAKPSTSISTKVNLKSVTTKRTNTMVSQYTAVIKSNGNIHKPKHVIKQQSQPLKIAKNALLIPVPDRLPVMQKVITKNSSNIARSNKNIQGVRCLSNLPPTITIKRTKTVPKRVAPYTGNNDRKRQKIIKEVLTVDLVDDELTTPLGPKWYLRPEEESECINLKEENNSEPDNSKLVEIVIEDSPVKDFKINNIWSSKNETCVTIEDSPLKTAINEHAHHGGSDEERVDIRKEPHSKKKLNYPKTEDNKEGPEKIEIHVLQLEKHTKTADMIQHAKQSGNFEYAIEIEESPVKQDNPIQSSSPTKCPVKPYLNNIEIEIATKPKVDEFHPVYQSFINLCFELENSDDMKKIIDKKIKAYYRQVPKSYTESEDFIDMVSSKILAMKAGPEKMYLYIKDIVDELNFKRKLAKSQPLIEEIKKGSDNNLYAEDSEFDLKRQRQIRKLEKTLKKLHRAIQKLEEQEVDFDDEEDSVYLLTERYKERLVRVHAKYCQLTNTKMPSEPRVQIDARQGQPKGPAKRLEKIINKKVPIGTPLPFPDFHDVLRCVREANDEDKLGWNDADIMEEARDLFTRCGKKLQRRRQENEWRLAASRITIDTDPADDNVELKKKLNENMQTAIKKETEVFNKYVDRQTLLKLEAVEIGDKEADESPVESGEEEVNEEITSLETTEKRKKRLKRLIIEKSKKNENTNSQPFEKNNLAINEGGSTDLQNKNIEKENEGSEDNKNVKKDEINNKAIEVRPTNVETICSEPVQNVTLVENKGNILSVSGDSDKIGSDIDELHLLQKLNSENEMNSSTVDSSDSETLDSSSDIKKPHSDEFNSIENSSYSEEEICSNKPDCIENITDSDYPPKEILEEINIESENKNENTEKLNEIVLTQSNNSEHKDSGDNILLASSEEDEVDNNKDLIVESQVSVNLKDDSISIGETIVEGHKSIVNSDITNELIKKKLQDTAENVAISLQNFALNNGVISENSQISELRQEDAAM